MIRRAQYGRYLDALVDAIKEIVTVGQPLPANFEDSVRIVYGFESRDGDGNYVVRDVFGLLHQIESFVIREGVVADDWEQRMRAPMVH